MTECVFLNSSTIKIYLFNNNKTSKNIMKYLDKYSLLFTEYNGIFLLLTRTRLKPLSR